MGNLKKQYNFYILSLVVLCLMVVFGTVWIKGVERQETLQSKVDFNLAVFEDGTEEEFLPSNQRALNSFKKVSTHLETDGDGEIVHKAEAVYVFNGTVDTDFAIDSVAYISNNPNVLLCEVAQNGKPLLGSESNAFIIDGIEAQKYCRVGVIVRIYDERAKNLTANDERKLDDAWAKELNDGFLTVRVSFSNGAELEKKYSICYGSSTQQSPWLIIVESQ